MIVGSFNIRGGGSLIKRKKIRSLITRGRADFFLLQETKIKEVSEALVKSLWGDEDMAYSFSASEGLSGGLVSMWKTQTVSVEASFSGPGYLGTKVRRKGDYFYVV